MNPYGLLLLFAWSCMARLSLQCDTGFAMPGHALSVPRSLMANADVAMLKTYRAESLEKCLQDCCTGIFGSCSVASFKKNASELHNCLHFNCRPISKCKFLSSKSTDTFSFSSSRLPQHAVPSNHTALGNSSSDSSDDHTEQTTAAQQDHTSSREEIKAFSEGGEIALKNDNTTVKPRKGVGEEYEEAVVENATRSGVKPRKGVVMDEVVINNSKSKIKPRKGVGPYSSSVLTSDSMSTSVDTPSATLPQKTDLYPTSTRVNYVPSDLFSVLEKVFEDDTTTTTQIIVPTETSSAQVTQSFLHPTSSASPVYSSSLISSYSSSSYYSHSSYSTVSTTTPRIAISSYTPVANYTTTATTQLVAHTEPLPFPSSSIPAIMEHSRLLFDEVSVVDSSSELNTNLKDEQAESERKYKSSMHLVLSLVFGLLVLFAVLGVVAKRVYDSWLRRHYRRMDFLIDGMYNGYG